MARKQKQPSRKPASRGRRGVKKFAPDLPGETTTLRDDGLESWLVTPDAEPILLHKGMDPLIYEAIKTFARELPSLQKEYDSNYWVVYRGRERLGASKSIDELYAQMRNSGVPNEELFFYPVSPIRTRGMM